LILRHARRWPLLVILLVYLIAGSIYAIVPPFLEVSDEVRHYAMVEHLAQGKGLPVQDPVAHKQVTTEERQAKQPLTYYAQEGSQPPLYYALMALVALPFDRSDFAQRAHINPHGQLGRADATSNWNQLIHTDAEAFPWQRTTLVVHILRFIGVLLGAVTVACTYVLALELRLELRIENGELRNGHSQFSILHSQFVAAIAAALVAFNPMFLHITASVNNDTLAAALSSLALLLGARMIRRGASIPKALVLGVVLGGVALSKASGLALVVVVPFFVLLSEFLRMQKDMADKSDKEEGEDRERSSWSTLVSLSVSILFPALLLAGWWYVRNQTLYGDFTGTTMMARIAGAREVPPTLLELIGEWDGFFKSYWGLFGAVNIPMDSWIYAALEVMLVLAGVGLLLVIGDWLKEMRDWRLEIGRGISNLQSPISNPQSLISLMLFSAVLVAFVALIRWTSLTLASQGRLLFPVISVISIFVALGLVRIAYAVFRALHLRDTQYGIRAFVMTLITCIAALALLSPFLYIQPAYAAPSRLQSESQLPAGLTRTELLFDDKIRWIGFRVNTPKERVQPGDVLDLTLYWQGLKPMGKNYSAFLRLFGRDDTEVYVLDTYPGSGMWQTTRWQPGEIIADRYRLRIADTITNATLTPTVLRLDVGFWDFGAKAFMQTFDPAGNATGRQRYEVAGMNAPVQPIKPNTAPLKQRLEKASVSNVRVAQKGRKLKFLVDWLVTDDMVEDYTTFVQLFDVNGQKMQPQGDARALNGDFAPRWWRKGDVIADDIYTIDLSPDFPPGEYTLKFGLYKADGARMPAFDAKGQPIDDAALSVNVEVE
jgi:hypothetical protein